MECAQLYEQVHESLTDWDEIEHSLYEDKEDDEDHSHFV